MALSPDLAVDLPLDVIETTALAAVRITAFLVVAPFVAVAAGAWEHGMARDTQLAQEAS